jgi:hypothetical protein
MDENTDLLHEGMNINKEVMRKRVLLKIFGHKEEQIA